MSSKSFSSFPALLFAILLLAACGGDDGPPTSAPSIPTQVIQPASTATDTITPPAVADLPTPAIIAPTATNQPPPTVAPAATEAPSAVNLFAPADFGTDRNPLTGELVDDPANLNRRPLAIKISNAPPSFVRPQHGLNEADLVFEHVAEAGITRFTMIVYGRTPQDIGPIRSARLIDLEIPAMYDAALAFSGASVGVSRRLYASDFSSRILGSNEAGYYRTGANKPFEHTLHGQPTGFWQALGAKGLNTRPNFTSFMAFSDQIPAGGQPANAVNIDFNWETVRWAYDAESGRFLRWGGDQPHLDGNTGEQVRAANVIIVIANHVEDPTICEEIRGDTCAYLSVQAQIWGSGPVIIFRDGQRFDGTWQRANRSDMLTFTDAVGQPLPLQIGNSWFEIVPTWYANPISVE